VQVERAQAGGIEDARRNRVTAGQQRQPRDGQFHRPLAAQRAEGAAVHPRVDAGAVDAVGGAEEQFRGLFEDQVLLAKLHLTAASVIDGGLTARYRQHCGSSTA